MLQLMSGIIWFHTTGTLSETGSVIEPFVVCTGGISSLRGDCKNLQTKLFASSKTIWEPYEVELKTVGSVKCDTMKQKSSYKQKKSNKTWKNIKEKVQGCF